LKEQPLRQRAGKGIAHRDVGHFADGDAGALLCWALVKRNVFCRGRCSTAKGEAVGRRSKMEGR
jgi:hypothetical protein